MPQILALALVGGAAYLGARWLGKQAGRVAKDLRDAEAGLRDQAAKRVSDAAGTQLERDPATGVYRPTGDGTAHR